ncbi:MAG: hypothetical protein ACRDH2_09165 [Anaerolineales bacterium]
MSSPAHSHTYPPTHLYRDLLALFTLALALNTLAASFISQPGYMDAYYYFGGALQLARGRGFTEPYLWNYLALSPNASSLITPFDCAATGLRAPLACAMGEGRGGGFPSHLYWMPLTSMIAAPFLALAERLAGTQLPNGTLFRVAQIAFVSLASVLPLLCYAVAELATGLRRHARAAALLAIFSGFYVPFWPNTDAFTLYGLAAGGALLAAGLAVRSQSARWFFIAGLCAGLAHLTRADGVLLILVICGLSILRRYGIPATRYAFFFSLSGYLLIVLPWLLRNWLAVGALLAPGGMRALWLTEYNDIFNYPADTLTPARYFASGWAVILAGKWSAFLTNAGTLIGPLGLIVAFPFIVAGLWRLRRNPLFAPVILYGLSLFVLMTLVFTFPGARGGLFHSGAALLPFFFPAALVGLDAAVEAAARRRPHWQPEKAKPVFTALLIALAAGLTALIFQMRVIGPDPRRPSFSQANVAYSEIGDWLTRGVPCCAPTIVAVNNPPGFYYFTGHPGIVIPNGGPDALLRVMKDFGARWAVLDSNTPAGLKELYTTPRGEPRLQLRATFTDEEGRSVYLFELKE